VQTLQISTKSTAQFWSNSCLKNGTQKKKFPIWKSRLSSSYAIPPVTVCAQSGRYLHRHLHVSCADLIRSLLLTDFLSADPVVSICRRSRSSAEQAQSLSGNSSNNFLALLPLPCLKILISTPFSLVKTIDFYVIQTRHKDVTNIMSLFVTLSAVSMLIGIFHIGKFCFQVPFFKKLLLRNHVVDFVEICNVCARKTIIEAAKRIINSD